MSVKRALAFTIGSLAALTACSIVTSLDKLTGSADASIDANAKDSGVDAGGSRYRAAVMADRPVGYWRLGDPSAAVAVDEIQKHDGIYGKVDGGFAFGVPGALAGDPNGAVRFFGAAEIVVGNAFGFPNAAPFSIEMWVNADPLGDGGFYERIVSNEAPKEGYHVELGPPGKIGIVLHGADASTGVVATLSFGSFVHVVCVRDAGSMKVYLDGALAAQLANPPTIAATTDKFTIGGASYGTDLFRGTLDEVAIYDVALTATQIQAHYAAGK